MNQSSLAVLIFINKSGNFDSNILSKKLSLLSCSLKVFQSSILPLFQTVNLSFFIKQAGRVWRISIFSSFVLIFSINQESVNIDFIVSLEINLFQIVFKFHFPLAYSKINFCNSKIPLSFLDFSHKLLNICSLIAFVDSIAFSFTEFNFSVSKVVFVSVFSQVIDDFISVSQALL